MSQSAPWLSSSDGPHLRLLDLEPGDRFIINGQLARFLHFDSFLNTASYMLIESGCYVKTNNPGQIVSTIDSDAHG